MTFKLTRLPDGYPNGFKFPEGMKPNLADYEDRYRLALPLHTHPPSTHTRCGLFFRGWCFCESSVSNLVKDYDFVLDLAKFDESVKDLEDVVKGCAAKRAAAGAARL